MKIKFVIITYNRGKVLVDCVNSLFGNTKIRPEETWIIDDGSTKEIQATLVSLAEKLNNNGVTTNLLLSGKNYGIGYSFERAYNIMRQDEDSDIICFIESDYVWRAGWLEDVVATFEASPNTVAIAGTDHPDMYDRSKTHGEFCKLMVDQFGRDLEQREYLYNHFILDTKRGPIKVQGVSNSCGCQIVHWKRLKELFKDLSNTGGIDNDGIDIDYEKLYWSYMDRAFHKNNTGDRRFASDAHMSGTLSMFAEKLMKLKSIDIARNFGFLSISDYSISSHICGGGINGKIVPEGYTFIHSPSWNPEFFQKDPRQ